MPSLLFAGRPIRLHGFTLTELLVVVAILALLAALLMPVLASAREQARETACLARAQQIGRAQLLYMQDWDERFPHWCFPAPPRPQPHENFTFWTEYFQPYLRGPALLQDTSARWIWDWPIEEKLADYVLATWGAYGEGTSTSPYWHWPGPQFSLAEVRRPAETIAVLDGFTTGGWTSLDLERHRGGMNVGFVDGHARWLRRGEFFRQATDGSGYTWMHYATADR